MTGERELTKLLAEAEKCADQGAWREAASLAAKAGSPARSKSAAAIRARTAKLCKRIDVEANRRFELARRQQAGKKHAESLKAYCSIVSDFPKQPCAGEAAMALDAAAKDPERKGLLDPARAEVMDEALAGMIASAERSAGKANGSGKRADRVKALAAASRAGIVAELKRMAKLYPQLPQGRRAAADLKAL